MYVVAVKVDDSNIEGKGVFALADIKKGSIVWQFTNEHDIKITPREYEALDKENKSEVQKFGYLSPLTNLYVYPPKGDAARFTNHSQANNLTAIFDPQVSEEPYFIANRDIKSGEELTNNYLEFDKVTQNLKPAWI